MSESSRTWNPKNTIRKDRVRTRVWDELKKEALHDPQFQTAVNQIGLFHFMHVVDVVADAIVSEQNEQEPLQMRLDMAESEIGFLRAQLDGARELIGRDPLPPYEAARGVLSEDTPTA